MSVQKLEKRDWRSLLDRLSKLLEGRQAEVEVNALAFGGQTEIKWAPLIGVAYDPKNDVIELALDGLDHLIQKPRDVFVDAGAGLTANLEIVDADGARHIVKFKDPLMLPEPQGEDRPGKQT